MLYNKNWNRNQKPAARLLLEAADLIERHGHTKNQLYDDKGSLCFLGALYGAKGNDSLDADARAAASAVRTVVGLIPEGLDINVVVLWNNAPERTGAEVVDAMRRAAAMLEERS